MLNNYVLQRKVNQGRAGGNSSGCVWGEMNVQF